MAQRVRISTLACDAVDEVNAGLTGIKTAIVTMWADGLVTEGEVGSLLGIVDEAQRSGEEADALTDDVDVAITVSVAGLRTGVRGVRRGRVLKEVAAEAETIAA